MNVSTNLAAYRTANPDNKWIWWAIGGAGVVAIGALAVRAAKRRTKHCTIKGPVGDYEWLRQKGHPDALTADQIRALPENARVVGIIASDSDPIGQPAYTIPIQMDSYPFEEVYDPYGPPAGQRCFFPACDVAQDPDRVPAMGGMAVHCRLPEDLAGYIFRSDLPAPSQFWLDPS